MCYIFLFLSGLLVYEITSPFTISLAIICLSFFLGMSLSCFFSKWIGLALILIFIGGIIVVFIYTTSLSPNLKILKLPKNLLFLSLIFNLLIFINHSSTPLNPKLIFRLRFYFLLIFLIFYLLITLFIIAKLSESFKGSLAQKTF